MTTTMSDKMASPIDKARWLAAVAAILATVAISGHAPAMAEVSPALRELVTAAGKEGELRIMWSANTMGGPGGAKAFEAAMNKTYGTNIAIKWSPGPSMPNMGNQIAMRHTNKLESPTDVYIGFSRNLAALDQHALFQPAPWSDYMPGRITSDIVEQGGTMVKITTATLGFTYNVKLAPSVPERVSDFLKPEWKGKVATTPYGAGFDQLAAADAWGKAKAVDFAKQFTNQVAGLIRCSEAERLSSGEFLALIFDCSGDSMEQAIAKGAPLKRIIAPDVPLVSYFYFAVPKNARNPNAAKLFITHALSKDGHKLVYDQTGSDLHLLPGTVAEKAIREVEQKHSMKFKSADVAWQIANTEGNTAQVEIQKILRSARK